MFNIICFKYLAECIKLFAGGYGYEARIGNCQMRACLLFMF